MIIHSRGLVKNHFAVHMLPILAIIIHLPKQIIVHLGLQIVCILEMIVLFLLPALRFCDWFMAMIHSIYHVSFTSNALVGSRSLFFGPIDLWCSGDIPPKDLGSTLRLCVICRSASYVRILVWLRAGVRAGLVLPSSRLDMSLSVRSAVPISQVCVFFMMSLNAPTAFSW
jgi:hypothetical protein